MKFSIIRYRLTVWFFQKQIRSLEHGNQLMRYAKNARPYSSFNHAARIDAQFRYINRKYPTLRGVQ